MLRTLDDLRNPKIFTENLGLTPEMLEKIGAIVVLSGNIEYTLENAFVTLSGGKIQGDIPSGTKLVSKFKDLNKKTSRQYTKVIDSWCRAAFVYLSCRNSIIHGNAIRLDDTVMFAKSLPIEGVGRNPNSKYSDFHANLHTLSLYLDAGTILSRVISIINISFTTQLVYSEEMLLAGLRDAWSTCAELTDLAAAYNNEKY